jgi:4-diphosphocytidyl-2C-methyl-D-erythritol kinase
MTTVGLFDNLVLEKQTPAAETDTRREGAGGGLEAGEGNRDGAQPAPVVLVCDLPGLPCDERNLVVRIAHAFREEVMRSGNGGKRVDGGHGDTPDSISRRGRLAEEMGIHATLHKQIPVGAGLGGGSSDAARTLLGLNQLWEAGRAANDLSAFAARFGSDLSFFCHGPSSVCRGRGEVVVPIPRPRPKWAVLVLPKLSMPTADVYRRFDQLGLGREADVLSEPDWNAWTQLNSRELLSQLVNDLEPPAFDISPALGKMRESYEKLLGRIVRMSGSGSSLFTLFDDEAEAKDVSRWIEKTLGERAPAVEVSPDVLDDLNES